MAIYSGMEVLFIWSQLNFYKVNVLFYKSVILVALMSSIFYRSLS